MASGAPALDDPRNVQLDFHAERDCVSEDALIEGVRARTPRVRFVEQSGDRIMHVSFVRNRSGQVKGELSLVEGEERTPLRQILAASCADATEGMALILAITLDPEGVETSTEPSVNSETTPGPTPLPQTSTNTRNEAPAASPTNVATPQTANAPTLSTEKTSPLPTPSEESPPKSVAYDEPWSFGAALGGELSFGAAPSMMRGIRGQLSLATERTTTWSPAILIGGGAAWSSLAQETEGDAEFILQALTLDLCALRFGAATLEVRVCAAMLGGRLLASASNTRNSAGTVSRPYVSVGGLASVHARPSEHFGITARVALLGNLVRDEFVFTPRVFHEVAPVTFSLSLLAGFRLPY